MSSLISVPVSTVVALTAERAVELMTGLLKAESAYAKLNPSVVTISSRLTVADGGIDAEVDAPPDAQIPADCFFAAGLTGIQLKSGASFKPWTESSIRDELLSSAGQLLPEVKRLTERRGRYVVVCTGHDLTPQQRNEACAQITGVLESAGVADYGGLVDVLGASQLSTFAERYPGTAALLAFDSMREAWVLGEWERDAHMVNAFQVAPEQTVLVNQIRAGIEGDAKHIRVLGEPGLGKTRMVLEALRTPHVAPSVLYLRHGSKFGQTTLFRQLLRFGWTKPLVLVLDDLAEAEMADVWRHLKTRCGAMKLITLDHGRDEGHDAEILRLKAPRLPDETIKSILSERVGELPGLDRWVTICEGSPRVAHAVAENLRANPADLLRPPATVPLWSRFLHGYGVQEDAASRQVDCVAHHLALFSRFGYEDPVSDEAAYISQMIQKLDPTIGWARFQEIVQSLRARRVLQGSRTLFFVPKALHIYLWKQFWTRYGRGFDFASTFATMPPTLHAWFLNKFRFAEGKDTTFVIEDILKSDGVFSNRELLTSSTGSQFLSTLAEANPSAVLRLFESTIGTWKDSELADLKSDRQNFVWALEKIAVWPQFTVRALNVLARLAVNENASNSNNATGTLVSLFRIGPEAAVTEASPEQRLPALLRLLRSSIDAERLLGLKALGAALYSRGGWSRIVGPEYQGLRERAKLWIPSTYGDWWQAQLVYFRVLIDETSAWPPELRPQICSALLKAVEHQIRIPPCTGLAFQTLEQLTSDSAMDPSALNKFFWHWREYQEDEHHRELAGRLRRLARRFARRDLASRFQRYVLDVDWLEWEEDYRDRREQPPSHAKALVRALARRVARDPRRFPEISHLLAPTAHAPAIWYFGEQLAASDKDLILLPLLVGAQRSGHGTCLHGYLTGLRAAAPDSYETWLIEMLGSGETAELGAEMALRSPYAEKPFFQCLNALEAGWIEPSMFGALQYGKSLDLVPTAAVEHLFRMLRDKGTPDAMRLLVSLLDAIDSDRSLPCGIGFVLFVVTTTIPSEEQVNQSFSHCWKRLCLRLVKADPAAAVPLLDAILTAMGQEFRLSYDPEVVALSSELVALNPEEAWRLIAKQFESSLPQWRSDLHTWLKGGLSGFDDAVPRGPIADLPIEAILSWIEHDREERAALMAHAALPTLDDGCGGRLTCELLARYGTIRGVRSGISASFHSGSWTGPASHYLKRKREALLGWLAAGLELSVVQWIEQEIERYDREIQAEEINEERDRFE